MIYNFFDYDSEKPEIEYDITGTDHRIFLEICCKYCAVVSFQFTENDVFDRQHRGELERFRIDPPTWVRDLKQNPLWHDGWHVRYFRVCQDLCNLLQDIAGGIFQWLDGWGYCNPEDPMFFREDGSIFFASMVHEGKCILAPRADEDVSRILSIEKWYVEPEEIRCKWIDWRKQVDL